MSKIKHFFQQSWLLITASFLFGLLIAVTSAALTPRIELNEKNKLYSRMEKLITDANSFEIAMEKVQIAGKKGKIVTTDIYKALDINNKTLGYAFIAIGSGFADKIKLVIAVDAKCERFFGFDVLASNETPGFGSKIKEDYFANQFKNAPAGKLELAKIGDPEKTDDLIVAISGATVSSDAVVKIFNSYIDTIKENLQSEGLIIDGN